MRLPAAPAELRVLQIPEHPKGAPADRAVPGRADLSGPVQHLPGGHALASALAASLVPPVRGRLGVHRAGGRPAHLPRRAVRALSGLQHGSQLREVGDHADRLQGGEGDGHRACGGRAQCRTTQDPARLPRPPLLPLPRRARAEQLRPAVRDGCARAEGRRDAEAPERRLGHDPVSAPAREVLEHVRAAALPAARSAHERGACASVVVGSRVVPYDMAALSRWVSRVPDQRGGSADSAAVVPGLARALPTALRRGASPDAGEVRAGRGGGQFG